MSGLTEVRHSIGAFALLPAALARDGSLHPNTKAVLLAIASHADERRQAFPGVALLQQETGLAERSVRRALLEAETAGWLRRTRRKSGNLYLLLWPEPAPGGRSDRPPEAAETGLVGPVPLEQDQEQDQGTDPPEPDGSCPPSSLPDGVSRTEAAALVFDAWAQTMRSPARVVLTEKRRRRILDRLREGYDLEDLLDAVRGWQASPFHRGENRDGTVYNDLDLLLRDGAHVERFRDLYRGTAPVGPGPVSARQREQEALLGSSLRPASVPVLDAGEALP